MDMLYMWKFVIKAAYEGLEQEAAEDHPEMNPEDVFHNIADGLVKTQMQKWARLPVFDDVEDLINVKYADTLEELVDDFRAKGYRIIGTSPHAEAMYADLDYTADDFIIVFGTEVSGLGRAKLEMMDTTITIPMLGNVDSLNLATSVAIVMYEILRQQGFKGKSV